MTPLLSLITVNYGSSEKIFRLSASLERFSPSFEWEWIIVDNPSRPNGEGEKLNTFFEQKENVRVIPLPKNVGFGRGNDQGVTVSKGKFLAFVNPDTEVREKTFEELIDFLEHNSETEIVVPVLFSPDGKVIENVWKFPTLLGLLKRRLFPCREEPKIPESPTPVAWAQGSFLLMRRAFYKKIGGFDHRFFLFFEDTDLCRRTWEKGGRVVQVPQSKAVHEEKRLSGKGIFKSLRRKTFWIHVFSMIQYFWKYRKEKTPKIF